MAFKRQRDVEAGNRDRRLVLAYDLSRRPDALRASHASGALDAPPAVVDDEVRLQARVPAICVEFSVRSTLAVLGDVTSMTTHGSSAHEVEIAHSARRLPRRR